MSAAGDIKITGATNGLPVCVPTDARTAAFIAVTLILVLLTLMYFWSPGGIPDFDQFYRGARLLSTPGLYDPRAHLELQRQIHGVVVPTLAFVRWPIFAALLYPVSRLPFAYALLVWRVLSIGEFFAAAVLWKPRRDAAAAIACSIPAVASILLGQDTPLLLLCLIGSIVLWTRSYPFAAGLLLSGFINKPHLLLLMPIVIIRCKEWRVGSGLAVGVGALFAASCLLQGPYWISEYLRAVLDPRIQDHSDKMPNIYSLVHGSIVACAFLILATLVAAWFASGKGVPVGIAACVLGALLISPHAWVSDYVLSIPLCLLALERKTTRLPALLLLSPVAFLSSVLTVVYGLALVAITAAAKHERNSLPDPVT